MTLCPGAQAVFSGNPRAAEGSSGPQAGGRGGSDGRGGIAGMAPGQAGGVDASVAMLFGHRAAAERHVSNQILPLA
jgi:hypothetical protein